MRFQTKNALNLFSFDEVTIKQIEQGRDSVTVVMDALIAKALNPNNEELVDRFVDTANVRFAGGQISEIIKEGYKYYDANGKLLKVEQDRILPRTEYDSFLKKCNDIYLFDIIAADDTEGAYEYQLGVDLDTTDTYWITIKCAETVVEWEKFKNRVLI